MWSQARTESCCGVKLHMQDQPTEHGHDELLSHGVGHHSSERVYKPQAFSFTISHEIVTNAVNLPHGTTVRN